MFHVSRSIVVAGSRVVLAFLPTARPTQKRGGKKTSSHVEKLVQTIIQFHSDSCNRYCLYVNGLTKSVSDRYPPKQAKTGSPCPDVANYSRYVTFPRNLVREPRSWHNFQ